MTVVQAKARAPMLYALQKPEFAGRGVFQFGNAACVGNYWRDGIQTVKAAHFLDKVGFPCQIMAPGRLVDSP